MQVASSAKKVVRACVPRSIRNWVRAPRASARWSLEEVRFFFGGRKTIELRPGWQLLCHPAAYRTAYRAQAEDPEQVAEFDAFISHSAPAMTLFDVGAHFGLFSLAALHYGGTSSRAVAVDPSPVAARFVKLQAKLNGVSSRLQVVQASAGDSDGWRDMISVGVQASGYYIAPSKEHPRSELTKTRAITLDELAREFRVRPTHIKIDVEGDEASVLRGGSSVLSTEPAPLLFVELHNEIVRQSGRDPAETLALLRDYGYQTFTVENAPIDEAAILSQPLVRIIARKLLRES